MFVIKNCAEGNVTLIIENAGVDEDLLIQFTILAQDQSTVVGVVEATMRAMAATKRSATKTATTKTAGTKVAASKAAAFDRTVMKAVTTTAAAVVAAMKAVYIVCHF